VWQRRWRRLPTRQHREPSHPPALTPPPSIGGGIAEKADGGFSPWSAWAARTAAAEFQAGWSGWCSPGRSATSSKFMPHQYDRHRGGGTAPTLTPGASVSPIAPGDTLTSPLPP
jgi:hypothetical protein